MTDGATILTELRSGTTPERLAEKFDMRKQTVAAMLDHLVHQGLVKKIDCSSGCKSCMMGTPCAGSGSGREKLYIVDEKNE